MNLKTILKPFFRDHPNPEEIWRRYTKGEKLSKKELKIIIEILVARNLHSINEIIDLKRRIEQMQFGFDYAQRRLLQKIQ